MPIPGSEWNTKDVIAVGIIPVLTLLFKYLVDRRTQNMANRGEWRGDVETMRDSWKETWEALSQRVERAEEGEADCLKRNERMEQRQDENDVRMAKLEGGLEEMTRLVQQKNEAIQILEMEKELAEKRRDKPKHPDEDGDPR